MVDTHAHLDLCDDPEEALVERAVEAGVERIMTVGTEPRSHAASLEIAAYDEHVFAALGWHPHEASSFSAAGLTQLAEAASESQRVRAIGEIGLDFYRDLSPRRDQERAFIAQLDLARQVDLPVVVHTRAAAQETFELLAKHARGLTVILHCFSAPERLDECVSRGYLCSFAGNVTYPKATKLKEAARRVPGELLLVETDAPYLAPQSLRGKPNEPAYVCETAEYLAELKGISYEELEETVEANAARAFGW